MPEDFHRESCRRQHRVIGQYLAMQAWKRGLDCIVLERDNLEFFLGLEQFKSTRLRWLREDLKPWFPHQVAHYNTIAASLIGALYLSRVPIERHLPSGSMTVDERLKKMAPGTPKTQLFLKQTNIRWRPPTEKDMVSQLAVITAGLAIPQEFPTKRKVS